MSYKTGLRPDVSLKCDDLKVCHEWWHIFIEGGIFMMFVVCLLFLD